MAGNTSNGTSNTSNTSNGGSNAGISGDYGGGWLLPDRVDYPFISDSYAPPGGGAAVPLDGQIVGRLAQQFRDRDWAAKWNAWRHLFEFIAAPGTAHGISAAAEAAVRAVWNSGMPTVLPNFLGMGNELDNLKRAARDERPEALGEILSQDAEFITEFMGLLGITPGSYPRTYRLLHVANLIGLYAVQHFKSVDPQTRNRPRPSQELPALAPPIPLPGHAAYPSGHATQAYLMALSIEAMLDPQPAIAAAPPFPALPAQPVLPFQAQVTNNVLVLARRTARNREIAGLHYPSDSEGGRVLAVAVLATLRNAPGGVPDCPQFTRLLAEAHGEWP